MKYNIIALVGEHMEHLFAGIREFPTEQIVLISQAKEVDKAEKIRSDLKKFNIPLRVFEIEGNIWFECFRAVAEIKRFADEEKLLINVATSDCALSCALTSAAFVNGIRAFTVQNGEVVFLPVLKFSYYKMLTDRKIDILKVLFKLPECCSSLEQLGRELKMSLPLVSYHINGTLKADGLKKLGLVETNEKKGRVEVKLTTLGKLLVKGYID
jgi:DNA-binding transcriptional ArsR family regulator